MIYRMLYCILNLVLLVLNDIRQYWGVFGRLFQFLKYISGFDLDTAAKVVEPCAHAECPTISHSVEIWSIIADLGWVESEPAILPNKSRIIPIVLVALCAAWFAWIMALFSFMTGSRLSALSPALQTRKHLYNICTMLDQLRRRWADVVQMLCKCFVFAPQSCRQDTLAQRHLIIGPTSRLFVRF